MKFNPKIGFFAILSIIVSCVPQELDNIQAFRYKFPELEEVNPLPIVELTLPPEVEVFLGAILIGIPAEELVRDVVAAVIDENISDINLAVIDDFSKISPEISTDDLKEKVNEEWIVGVLSGTIQPASDFILIAQIFKSDPDMAKYLAQIEFPQIDGFIVNGRIIFPDLIPKTIPIPESLRISTLVTPCKEAAEKLYLQNIDELEQQAVQQNAQALQFYDLLRSQAISKYNQRILDAEKIMADDLKRFYEFVVFFNAAVDALVYPDEVKRGLKIYIIAYVIQLRNQIIAYDNSYDLAIILERNRKLELIRFEQSDVEFSIRDNLTNAMEEQKMTYNTAVNNCHNQGAGG
jgi:hypothetical protein